MTVAGFDLQGDSIRRSAHRVYGKFTRPEDLGLTIGDEEPVDPVPNDVIADRYTVERLLGQGGMAIVYLCTDRTDGTRVALKVLRREIGSAVVIERFLREIALSSNLEHPRIPRVQRRLPGEFQMRVWAALVEVARANRRRRSRRPYARSQAPADGRGLRCAHVRLGKA